METINICFNYRGALIEAQIDPDQNYLGYIYYVKLNNAYVFTLYLDENEEWALMREPNGTIPTIETELFNEILKKLERKLKYAA